MLVLIVLFHYFFQFTKSLASGQLLYTTNDVVDPSSIHYIYKRTPHYMKEQGYYGEVHQVITDDGYILQIHRIPRGKLEDSKTNITQKQVVLITNGQGSNSDNWLLIGEVAMPYTLANAGYDVWMANSRGSTYGSQHVNLSQYDDAYWAYGLHEEAVFDIPAVIDYVLMVTGKEKLFSVAHSKATTLYYMLLSTRPQYNEKINFQIHLAPVAYLDKSGSLVEQLLFKLDPILLRKLLRYQNVHHSRILTDRLRYTQSQVCNDDTGMVYLCVGLRFLFIGFDYKNINMSDGRFFFSHFPDAMSLDGMLYFLQVGHSGRFARFDEGPEANKAKYGSIEPPEYPLELITAPTYLILSKNDYHVTEGNLQKLKKRLSSIVGEYTILDDYYNHLDFVITRRSKELLYDQIVRVLNGIKV